jgi:hypothetical protein
MVVKHINKINNTDMNKPIFTHARPTPEATLAEILELNSRLESRGLKRPSLTIIPPPNNLPGPTYIIQ